MTNHPTQYQSPDLPPKWRMGSRMLQLDILRGIAILLVLGRHFVVNANDAGFMLPFAGVWQVFGWTGVDLFFVLSGFLVGGLLCAEARDFKRIDVKRFIIRRGFKIWPLYYLFLLFIFALSFTGYPDRYLSDDERTASLWPSVVHIQNYMTVPRGESWWFHTRHYVADHIPSLTPTLNYLHDHMGLPRGHLWSLAIEEHFYLLLPAVMVFLLWRGRKSAAGLSWLPMVAIATMVGCLTLRLIVDVPTLIIDGRIVDRYPWFTHVFPTHMRIDGLFFGVLLSYLYHFKPAFPLWASRFRWALMCVGLALVSPMMLTGLERNPWVCKVGFTMLYLGYGCILVAAISMRTDWMNGAAGISKVMSRFLRVIGWVGLFSYPIYLWHQDIGRYPVQYMINAGMFDFGWLKPLTQWLPGAESAAFISVMRGLRWLLAMTVYLSLAIAISAIIGKAIERPVLALRDRMFPRRARAVDPPKDASEVVDEPALVAPTL